MKIVSILFLLVICAFANIPKDTVTFIDKQVSVMEYKTDSLGNVIDSQLVIKIIRPYERFNVPMGLGIGDTLYLLVRKSGQYGFERLHIYAPSIPAGERKYIQPLGKLEVQDIE